MSEDEVEIVWSWEFHIAFVFVVAGIILAVLALASWFIGWSFDIFLQLMIYAGFALIVALVFVVIMRYKGEKQVAEAATKDLSV